jgi:hypothetical protein
MHGIRFVWLRGGNGREGGEEFRVFEFGGVKLVDGLGWSSHSESSSPLSVQMDAMKKLINNKGQQRQVLSGF